MKTFKNKLIAIIGCWLMVIGTISAQEATQVVKGRVTDAATGKPLSGVLVAAYGESRFTAMTDDDGCYELKAPEYVRSVSMRVDGYNLVQRAISNGSASAQLYPESFAETYKRQTTATLNAEATHFENTSSFSADPLIAQQLGGDVRSVSRSGVPGVGNQMLIAGINSLTANAQPLVVIDDVILDMQYDRELIHQGYFNNILANINVNDIESVEVIKNGTALYGAKGANGVVFIHTKRNKSMATKIDVNINGRFEMTPRLPKMMSGNDYRSYATELLAGKTPDVNAMKFLASDPTYYYYTMYHQNTDWTDEVYHNAFSQNYGINVQGGDNVASYNLSVGYSLGDATLKKNDYSRFNMRLNSDIEVLKSLKVRFDAAFSDVDRSLYDDGAPANPLSEVITSPSFLALAKAPFLSPYAFDKRGVQSQYLAEADDYLESLFDGRGRLANPTAVLSLGEGKNRNSMGNRHIVFSVMPRYEFNKHLTLSEHFALTLVNTNEEYYMPKKGTPTFVVTGANPGTTLQNHPRYGYNGGDLENIRRSMAASQTNMQSDTRLTWKNQYDAHSIHLMGGFRYLSNSYNLTAQGGYNTGDDKNSKLKGGLKYPFTSGVDDNSREMAWYALGSYNYAQRYYLDAGISAQASSRFGEDVSGLKLAGVVWGLFPSIEGAWVLTNEKWFPANKGIDYLRLNVGFDVTGNDAVDYSASRSYFVSHRMLGSTATGLVLGNIGNTELKWETTRRLTVGLEGNFINNRLHARLNLFKSWTSDLLSLQQLAWTSGLEQNWGNGGKLENSGFDVSLSAKVLNLKDFRWELGASAGHYNNKVTALPDNDRAFETNICGATVQTKVGQPVGLFYGHRTNGVYATTADAKADNLYFEKENTDKVYFEAGDMRFVDVNQDGKINDADRVVIGDPNPDVYGHIFTTMNWKRLTLSAVFNYSIGNDIYNYQRSLLEGGSLFLNQTTAVNSRWKAEGQQTSVPRVSYNDPMGNSRFSDRWIEDGSYLRLSSVTLSYYVPIQSTYLQGLTIWGNASNLFTLTKYLGNDPDCVMSTGGILSQGIDRGYLTAGRSFSLGVNINL